MGWTHGLSERRDYRKDLRQRSKKVAENEEDHSYGRIVSREIRERQRRKKSGGEKVNNGDQRIHVTHTLQTYSRTAA